MRCNTCKSWKKGSHNIGKCSCEKFKLGYSFREKDSAPDEVWVVNDEGWGFYTGAEFGCIHHTALDTKQEKTYTMAQVINMVKTAEAMGGLKHIHEVLKEAEHTGTMGEGKNG